MEPYISYLFLSLNIHTQKLGAYMGRINGIGKVLSGKRFELPKLYAQIIFVG